MFFLPITNFDYKHEGGLDFQKYLEFSSGADLLIHDAEYKEEEYKKNRGWGHSCYKDTLNLAMNAGVKKLGLFHHNQERIDDEIDAIVNDCQGMIKRSGKKLKCFAVGQSMEFKL